MKCCEECANACWNHGTRYDPPEDWCRFERAEYDMEDDEVVEMMIEEQGAAILMAEQGVDDPEDLSPECPYFEDGYNAGPDPDVIYDMWRDERFEYD